jgi:hypothetical protein
MASTSTTQIRAVRCPVGKCHALRVTDLVLQRNSTITAPSTALPLSAAETTATPSALQPGTHLLFLAMRISKWARSSRLGTLLRIARSGLHRSCAFPVTRRPLVSSSMLMGLRRILPSMGAGTFLFVSLRCTATPKVKDGSMG